MLWVVVFALSYATVRFRFEKSYQKVFNLCLIQQWLVRLLLVLVYVTVFNMVMLLYRHVVDNQAQASPNSHHVSTDLMNITAFAEKLTTPTGPQGPTGYSYISSARAALRKIR